MIMYNSYHFTKVAIVFPCMNEMFMKHLKLTEFGKLLNVAQQHLQSSSLAVYASIILL